MSTLLTLLTYAYRHSKYPRSGSHSYRFCNTTRDLCGCENHYLSHTLNSHLTWWEYTHMARSKGKPVTNSFTPVTFVRADLNAEDKKHYAEWQKKSVNDLDTLVIEMLQANHKISFSYAEASDSFIVSVTGKADDCINASRCFTSHAKDYGTALWVACYKYHVVWQRGVWEEMDDGQDFG